MFAIFPYDRELYLFESQFFILQQSHHFSNNKYNPSKTFLSIETAKVLFSVQYVCDGKCNDQSN